MVKIKLDLEKVFLALFFAIILFLGPGTLFDHKIRHDFPFAYGASDAFQHQVRAESIKDAGNFIYEAFYISKGVENTIGRYPPALYHLAVNLSYASGMETYDAIYFIVVFFEIIAAFTMYFAIRTFSKTAAMLSLPLSLLVFSFPVSLGILWGHWPSVMAQFFIVLLIWSVTMMGLDKSFILIALSLSATALVHTSETVFAFIFLALFFGIKLLMRKLDKNGIKTIIISLAIFFVISFYYLVIFMNTWASGQPYTFAVQPVWEGNPGFYIAGFGLLLIPIIAGIAFSFPNLKNINVPFIAAYAMLISGFLNYAGFEVRSFQIRFLWPIYLSMFFGFGLYVILKPIIRKWNVIYAYAVVIVLILLIGGIARLPILKQTSNQAIPWVPQVNSVAGQGIMDQYHWSALRWLSENTPKEAKIYFFYGDIYSQDALLRNTKRLNYQADPENFVKELQNRSIKRKYVSEMPGDTGGTISVRPSFFKFEDPLGAIPKEEHFGPQDICRFDYLVFDKASRQPVLAQYNLLIASELAKKGYMGKVFENEVILILKNNNPGDDCIEERSF